MSTRILHQVIYMSATNGNLVPMKMEIRQNGVSIFAPAPVCNSDSSKILENMSVALTAQGIPHKTLTSLGMVDRISLTVKSVF